MSVPVSVCVIAADEEANIERCLASVAWAEERIVVLDARSRDRTGEIARDQGARVLPHPYEGNVEQKNFALAQARHEWVLALDADEAVSDELAREVQARVAEDPPDVAGYEVNRITFHLGRWIRHGDFFPDWQLRLFRRSRGRWEGVNPHGRVRVEGRVERLRGPLEHYSYRDFDDQLARIRSFARIQARALHAAGRRVRASDLVLRPPARFLRAYLLRRGFLDGVPGFVIAAASAFHVFAKYVALWELERAGRPREAKPARPGPGSEPGREAPTPREQVVSEPPR